MNTHRWGFGTGLTRVWSSGLQYSYLYEKSYDADLLTPTGYPPPNIAADTAHSAHITQPALRPHRARVNPNRSMLAPSGGPIPRFGGLGLTPTP